MNEAAITFAHHADGVLEAQQLGLFTPAEAIRRLQQFVVEFRRDEKSEIDKLFQYFHPALAVVHTAACAASSGETTHA